MFRCRYVVCDLRRRSLGGAPMLARRGILLFAALVAAAAFAACGSDGNGDNGGTPSDDGGAGDDGMINLNQDSGKEELVIEPMNPTLDVTGPGTSLQFKAHLSSSPATAVNAAWTIDVASIGTIDKNGLFTASGTLGGATRVSAQMGNLT